ncbi:unnamed protein product, partial [Anisakis simplex]|uniref:Protein tweety homolog n=1 Tax=Anisakis simplex TaxID=6269 RepID=A0A0M3J204_ANISI
CRIDSTDRRSRFDRSAIGRRIDSTDRRSRFDRSAIGRRIDSTDRRSRFDRSAIGRRIDSTDRRSRFDRSAIGRRIDSTDRRSAVESIRRIGDRDSTGRRSPSNRFDGSAIAIRRIGRLRCCLYVLYSRSICVYFSFCLGFCLFGNEHLNRAVTASINGIDDVARNFKLAVAQCNNLNDTRLNASKHVDSLSASIRKEADKSPSINKTLLNEAEAVITALNEKIDEVGVDLSQVKSVLSGVTFLEQVKIYSERIELERWILCVTLLSIMLIVLFAGVIAFCRQSKKGAVVFSGLGFAIFIVGWMLLAVILPATVSLSDFCMDGDHFIGSHLSNETIETLKFYRKCDPKPTHDNVPSTLAVNQISEQLSKIQDIQQTLNTYIHKLFNESAELTNGTRLVDDDIKRSLRGIGALETTVACYAYHGDVNVMQNGVCNNAVIGAAILTFCLFLLGAFMFALLLIVSKSWHLFTRLPSDYVEVDDEDPFFPRANDSTIPVDIYGTHVYNPRTRFANSLDRTEPSTNTTSVTAQAALMPNGTPQANNSNSLVPLLDGGNEPTSSTPWHRSSASSGGAPTPLQAQQHHLSSPLSGNAPPAVRTNSMMRSSYPTNCDESSNAYRYRNYHEQFDV